MRKLNLREVGWLAQTCAAGRWWAKAGAQLFFCLHPLAALTKRRCRVRVCLMKAALLRGRAVCSRRWNSGVKGGETESSEIQLWSGWSRNLLQQGRNVADRWLLRMDTADSVRAGPYLFVLVILSPVHSGMHDFPQGIITCFFERVSEWLHEVYDELHLEEGQGFRWSGWLNCGLLILIGWWTKFSGSSFTNKYYSIITSRKLFRFTGDINKKHTCIITLTCVFGHNVKCMSHQRSWFLDKGILTFEAGMWMLCGRIVTFTLQNQRWQEYRNHNKVYPEGQGFIGFFSYWTIIGKSLYLLLSPSTTLKQMNQTTLQKD